MRTHLTILTASAAGLALAGAARAQTGGPYDLTWSSIDDGGAMYSSAGVYSLGGTIGQPDAGALNAGTYGCSGGFWYPDATLCYANCDGSTSPPILNVLDFGCFLNRFAAGDAWANCDGSTSPPTLNVLDFGCFLNKFAAGCS